VWQDFPAGSEKKAGEGTESRRAGIEACCLGFDRYCYRALRVRLLGPYRLGVIAP
jgi:hypothetical protein